MVLKPITPALTTPATPPWRSLDPYKKATSNPGPHRPFFPSLPSSLAPSFTLAPSSSCYRSSLPSLRRCLSDAARALVSTPPASPRPAHPPPPPPTSTGVPQRPRAVCRHGAAAPSCPCRLGPWWTRVAPPGPRAVDLIHQIFHWKINPRNP
jgi:hypothetical protein